MGATYQFSQLTMMYIRVASSVLQFLGILLSIFRLWFRSRIRRLWWEDAWAFIACVCAAVLLATEWTYLDGGWEVSVVSVRIYAPVFALAVWAVRASILFSVARIVHSSEKLRYMMTGIAVSFIVMCLIHIILRIWWLTDDHNWTKHTSFYSMPARWLPCSLNIFELCTGCISDFILIALPVRLFWSLSLPTKQRRMIIAIFSSGVIVTVISIFRAVCQITNLFSLVGVATDIEVALSLITCNLLVVVTVLYRVFQRRQVSEPVGDDDYTTPVTVIGSSQVLTTVDLSAPEEFWGNSNLQANLSSEKSSLTVRA